FRARFTGFARMEFPFGVNQSTRFRVPRSFLVVPPGWRPANAFAGRSRLGAVRLVVRRRQFEVVIMKMRIFVLLGTKAAGGRVFFGGFVHGQSRLTSSSPLQVTKKKPGRRVPGAVVRFLPSHRSLYTPGRVAKSLASCQGTPAGQQ